MKTFPLLLILSVLGVLAILIATNWGIGVSPVDSVTYIDTARNVLHGTGFVAITSKGSVAPMTQYPPLYPASLAAVGLLGIDPLDGARWLHVFLFGSTVFLVGFMVYRYTDWFFGATILAAFFVFTSMAALEIYNSAMSEPLFIFFGLAGVLLLSEYLESKSFPLLLFASLLMALSFLARYAGITFVLTSEIGLILFNGRPWLRRVADAVAFALLGCAPGLAWMTRNVTTSGRVSQYITDVSVVENPWDLLQAHLLLFLRDVSMWVVPYKAFFTFRVVAFLGLIAFLSFAGIILVLEWKKRQGGGLENARLASLPLLLAMFIAVYSGFLAVSIVSTKQGALTSRFIIIIYLSLVVLLACLFHRSSGLRRDKRLLNRALTAIGIILAVVYLGSSGNWVIYRYFNGQGFSGKIWKESPVIAAVRELPVGTHILSNGADAVYIFTGRPAVRISWTPSDSAGSNADSGRTNLDKLAQSLREGHKVVVYFDTSHTKEHLMLVKELSSMLPLRTLLSTEDAGMGGGIYAAAD